MSDKKPETKPTGFAARMKQMMAGCDGNCGCCGGDIRIVPKEEIQDTEKPDHSE